MDAKTPSELPPASAKQNRVFEYPLGRILEPLGFTRHPLRFTICVAILILLFTVLCRQYCDADSCRYYRQNITGALGLFSIVLMIWVKVAMDLRIPHSGDGGKGVLRS